MKARNLRLAASGGTLAVNATPPSLNHWLPIWADEPKDTPPPPRMSPPTGKRRPICLLIWTSWLLSPVQAPASGLDAARWVRISAAIIAATMKMVPPRR